MITQEYMLDKILQADLYCEICTCRSDCSGGGVRGGPSGPIYPPCADKDFDLLLEEDLIEEVYNEYFKEDMVMIKKVGFYNPATVVFWEDGTKTVVRADGEVFDPEKGLAMAIAKKYLGNEGNYWNEFKKWLPKDVDNNA